MPVVFLAGLDAIVGGLVALLILLGVGAAAYFVGSFGANIPIIGGWLSSVAGDVLQAEAYAAQWFYGRFLWAIKTLIYAAEAVIHGIPDTVFRTSTAFLSVIGFIRWSLIPNTLSAARYYAGLLAADAKAYAWRLYVQATDYANALLSLAESYALSLWRSAIAYADAIAGDVADYALRLFRAAIAYVDAKAVELGTVVGGVYASLTADIASLRDMMLATVANAVRALRGDIVDAEHRAISAARDFAAAAESDAIKAVDVAASLTVGAVWPGIVTDVDELIKVIPGELSDVGDAVRAIPRVVPGDLADAMAALGVLAIPMLRFLHDCGVPMCRDLHGLSDLFADLSSAATDAALLAFLAMAAGNPQMAADDILTVARPVADATASVTRDLLGVG